jgi:hypothetical protein
MRYIRITAAIWCVSRDRGASPPGATRTQMGYALRMGFSEHEIEQIDRTDEVEIETAGADGAARRTIIWAVVDDGEVFIRSYHGPHARWYREALARPSVALHVDGLRLPAEAVPAADPTSIERTSAGLARKYPNDPAMPRMNRPEVLELTLRLERA